VAVKIFRILDKKESREDQVVGGVSGGDIQYREVLDLACDNLIVFCSKLISG
jgi:hypothetical protein